MSNKITVIIPVHELNNNDKLLFESAIESVKKQQIKPEALMVVTPIKNKKLIKYLNDFDYGDLNVTILENDGNTDFSSQINYGVKHCKTEWFNLLEFDDEMANLWIKNFKKYQSSYEEVDMFCPIVIETSEDNKFLSLTNEAIWAKGLSDEMGIINHDIVANYENFSIVGAAIKKDVFEEFGGLKTNIKLYFPYEFLLRMTLNSVNIMVIPKFGHKHTNLREGSLFYNYKNEINALDTKWWLNIAKKEYHFTEERTIIEE